MVSLWSVGEAPGTPAVTGTIVLYNDAANGSASEGSNQASKSASPALCLQLMVSDNVCVL